MFVCVLWVFLCKYKLINSVDKLYFKDHLTVPLSLASKAKAIIIKEAANISGMI